jgi:hypothetical protein
MMEDNFKELVDALIKTPMSIDILRKITLLIEQQTSQSFSSFISQSIQSLLALEYWAWQRLNHDSYQLINEPNYMSLFRTLASFNKHLIFDYDNIDDQTKASLLIPDNVDQINGIFEQINQNNDDNHPFIAIVSLWFDNLSFFIYENPQFATSPVISYINQYIERNYLITDQFKFYLTELQEQQIGQPIFTARQLFYIKTCLFSLSSYFCESVQNSSFTAEEMFHHIGNEYLQIINTHSHKIASWNKELLISITHLTGFIYSYCSLGEERLTNIKTFFPTEQILCDFSQALIRILNYKSFYKELQPKRSNSETILIDISLKFILVILHTHNMNWFFRSDLSLPDTLLIITENSTFEEICLCAYAVLGEVLTDEKLKELKVTDNIANYFCNTLEQAWHHPLKKSKHISALGLLRGESTLKIYSCKSFIHLF